MTSLQFVSHLIELYGMYGVFVLIMIEGDLTLLVAGVLAHSGFFFSSAVMGLIGDFRHVGKILLGILIGGVVVVYLIKRRWVSKKVEEIKPERLQQIEHAAIESVKELKDEIREKIHLK